MRKLKILHLINSRHICTTNSTGNLNYAISDCIRQGNICDARKLFDQNPTARNVVSWNSMISGYVKNNQMSYAQHLFDEMPVRDVVSWNTLLSGLQRAGSPEEVYLCFLEMVRVGYRPTEFTFSTVIVAFVSTTFSVLIRQLHGLVICSAFNSDVYVGSALMRAYTHLKDVDGMRRIFDEILIKELSTWNALILGFMDFGLTAESQKAFDMMPARNVVSWTTLVNGYINNGRLNEARCKFDMMIERNVLSWTTMIKGYVQYGNFVDALVLFISMLRMGPYPNQYTFSSVLEACAGSSSFVVGIQVHTCILRSGTPCDVILLTSLVDMYAKCGYMQDSRLMFEKALKRDFVTWNAMISGYAQHGLAEEALQIFDAMQSENVKPNHATFVAVLRACAHMGLVKRGLNYFYSMSSDYKLDPQLEHYSCMIDILGRSGQVNDALKLINEMPFEADDVIWRTLLSICKLQGNVEMAEKAATSLLKLDPQDSSAYILLSNIYADAGMWKEVSQMRKIMRYTGLKKEPGCSWIELQSELHMFLIGDKAHPRCKEIYEKLNMLTEDMTLLGYVPDFFSLMQDVDTTRTIACIS